MIDVVDFSLSIEGKKILHNVSCQLKPGITAIIGPSGVGKSSFLLTLNRLIDLKGASQFKGEIIFEGKNILSPKIDAKKLRKEVGIVFQRPIPFPVSILKNLSIVIEENGDKNGRKNLEIVEQVLKKVHLWDEVKDKLSLNAERLSGGQQQKLCLARTLLTGPKVILLDEPCSSLDPFSTLQIEALIKELGSEMQIVLVTHNLKQAKRVSNHVVVLGKKDNVGYFVEAGMSEVVFSKPQEEFTKTYLEYEAL